MEFNNNTSERNTILKELLLKGEQSGFVENFDPEKHLSSLFNKYVKKKHK